MVNTIAPMWNGNERWLVLGGTALFAMFPAHAIIRPSFFPTILGTLFWVTLKGPPSGYASD
jgi:cytochrome d ubiquinol oxidase subunit II